MLSTQHAGLGDAGSVTLSVVWLLELSLAQARPELSVAARQAEVRRLLVVRKT